MRVSAVLFALALVGWLSVPLCRLIGLDADLGWVANGFLPTAPQLAGTAVLVVARAVQCVVSPVLAGTALANLALARLLPSGPPT